MPIFAAETEALRAAKRAARAEARARQAAVPPAAWRACGAAMAAELFALPQWQAAQTVFCFVSMQAEPDTFPILRAALEGGKRLCVPRMLPHRQMEAVPLTALETLVPNSYGILEPAGAPLPQTAVIDLALIPCLAATRTGLRLGRGGGYYDRFLAGYSGQALLVCAPPLLFEDLPAGPRDIRLPALLTGDTPPAPGAI